MIPLKIAKANVTYKNGLFVLFTIPVDDYSELEMKEFAFTLNGVTFIDKDGNEFVAIKNKSILYKRNPLNTFEGDYLSYIEIETMVKQLNVSEISLISWEAGFANQILTIKNKQLC